MPWWHLPLINYFNAHTILVQTVAISKTYERNFSPPSVADLPKTCPFADHAHIFSKMELNTHKNNEQLYTRDVYGAAN